MADANGVLYRIIICFVFLSFHSFNQVSSLICYCAGHCPFNQPNGSCIARPSSRCFSAVEQVYNPATGQLENERTYGCLPPDESGFMLCKGHLVPHQVPKSIACCENEDWCNKHLSPVAVSATTTPNPMYSGEMMSYTGPYHLMTFIVSFVIILMILIVVIVSITIRFYNEKKNARGYTDVEKFGNDAIKNLIDNSGASSGSGSGAALLVQRSVGRQLEMGERIAAGHFGSVYEARFRDERVAVKVFLTSEEASWARETDIYKTVLLQHENILRFIAADIRGTGSTTQMLLVTQFMEKGSLYDYLKEHMLNKEAMFKMAYSAACGLNYLHSDFCGKQGKPAIAHRDIKSKNILVKNDITCCIADFGLAVKYTSETHKLDVATNNRVGTIRYMSPEVLSETLDPSHINSYKMSDMYSFALVLWEITRRCMLNDMVEDYQVPYYDCVPSNPSFEHMKKVVCTDQSRPALPANWSTSESVHKMSKIIQECWHQKPDGRLPALRVKKKLQELYRLELEERQKSEKLV